MGRAGRAWTEPWREEGKSDELGKEVKGSAFVPQGHFRVHANLDRHPLLFPVVWKSVKKITI